MRDPDTLRDLRYLLGQLLAIRDASEGRPHAHTEAAPEEFRSGYEAAYDEQLAKQSTQH